VTSEQNLKLIREIESNRSFLLTAYRQNPALLERADARIKALLLPLPDRTSTGDQGASEP
jgi:hypothetical protein